MIFLEADLPGLSPIGHVSFENYFPNKEIYIVLVPDYRKDLFLSPGYIFVVLDQKQRFIQALVVCGTLLIPNLRHSPILILRITYLNFTVV